MLTLKLIQCVNLRFSYEDYAVKNRFYLRKFLNFVILKNWVSEKIFG